jgi:hypothetical protein
MKTVPIVPAVQSLRFVQDVNCGDNSGEIGVTLLDLPEKTQLPRADDARVRGGIKAVVGRNF